MSARSAVLPRLSDYLDRHDASIPQQDAVVFGARRLSYRALKAQVDACARALLAAGMRRGDRIAVLAAARPEFWILFLAAARIGAIWVGLNPRYREPECRYVLDDSRPALLFADPQFDDVDHRPWLGRVRAHCPCLAQVVALESFEAFLKTAESVPDTALQEAAQLVTADDALALVYTSGSTGKPKGAVLSHYGLCFGSATQLAQLGVARPSTVVNFPINHVACIGDTCSMILVAGGTLVLQERFDAAAMLAAIQRERCTVLAGVPTMIQMLLAELAAARYDLSSVELVVWGGAALPRPAIEQLRNLGARLVAVYGLTETTTNVCFTPARASSDVLALSVGRPAPAYPCRIVDADGKPCPPGRPGELQFAGRYVMRGYWNRPAATREAFTGDGWLRTGDLGLWREDGNIQLVGRLKEMFKSGGYNVYPREIENVLEAHEAVAMAAVVSVPDGRYQEVGWAYVQPKAGANGLEESLRRHCREQLANYKIPKRILIREQLPVLPVGKLDKVALRAEALREAAETQSAGEIE